MIKTANSLLRIILAAVALGVAGCATTYYKMWQELGYEKRDILVSRVNDAKVGQTEAKQQFTTTLDQFKALTNFNGGDLEAEYKKLDASYEKCKTRAADVSKEITKVDKVAGDMFVEWEKELNEYHDDSLRASSAQKLQESKARYSELLAAMRKSEAKMQPVLDKFSDVVLELKHDLNAAAISSLQKQSVDIDTSVQSLIEDMNKSIDEANAFTENLKKS
jgi:hypothetical protein